MLSNQTYFTRDEIVAIIHATAKGKADTPKIRLSILKLMTDYKLLCHANERLEHDNKKLHEEVVKLRPRAKPKFVYEDQRHPGNRIEI